MDFSALARTLGRKYNSLVALGDAKSLERASDIADAFRTALVLSELAPYERQSLWFVFDTTKPTYN